MENPGDISNQWNFFENCIPEKKKGFSIKIDGINIGHLKMGGTVQKAKNAYIGRLKKSKTFEEDEEEEGSENSVPRSYRARSIK